MNHEVTLVTSDGHFDIVIDDDLVSRMGVDQANYETTKLFVSSWLTLLSDSPLNPTDKPKRLFRHFIENMKRDGLKKTVLGYSDIAHKIVSQHTLMGSDPERGQWIGDLLKETPVFFEYHRYYHTGDTSLLAYLYTFFNFGKKLDYVDSEFEKVAFRDWEVIDDGLADLVYEEMDLQNMHTILTTVLPSFVVDEFWPKFGPGSVAERGVRGRIDKISNLAYSPILDLLFFPDLTFRGERYTPDPNRIIPIPGNWRNGVTSFERVARLKFVPKNMKTSRSICMEPNTHMYFQQGVLRNMLKLIRSSDFGLFIDIQDQTVNQDLALRGSYSSEIDTIDLSAASDSVGLRLVKGIFPKTWLPPMLCTRSTEVEIPGGSIRKLNKFAPMGSALCFPTQCIIFTAVCIYAAYQYRTDKECHRIPAKPLTEKDVRSTIEMFSRTGSRRFFERLAIYGDDICCDRKITPYVVSILQRLGFKVNTSKSFVGSQSFRESCGRYYLAGSDITPLYFRVKGVKQHKLSAAHVASVVHTINECLDRGYVNLRRFLLKSLCRWNRGKFPPLPFLRTESNEFGIKVYGVPYNEHIRKRRSRYQRLEGSVWTISYRNSRIPSQLSDVDHYEYMRWWACRTSMDTSADSQAASRCDFDGASIRRRWIPLS